MLCQENEIKEGDVCTFNVIDFMLSDIFTEKLLRENLKIGNTAVKPVTEKNNYNRHKTTSVTTNPARSEPTTPPQCPLLISHNGNGS